MPDLLVKICGATDSRDIAALAAAGADFVGLWHGVRGGHAELGADALGSLAAAAAGGPAPVLVTLGSEVDQVRAAAEAAGLGWVQLHGYQPPAAVRVLAAAGLDVIKVLHVRGGVCVDSALIPAYQRAGARMFLVDSVGADGRIGSTAVPVDRSAALSVLAASDLPVLLAGGITADTVRRDLLGHPRLAGIDVDTGARDADGRIDAVKVAAIKHAWTAPAALVPEAR